MKKILLITLLAPIYLQAVEISQPLPGYKCILKPNTLKFFGGNRSAAKSKFSEFSGLNIFKSERIQTGGDRLKPIAPDSLEYSPIETITTTSSVVKKDWMNSDNLFPTQQTTMIFDKHENQLKKIEDWDKIPEDEGVIVKYTQQYSSNEPNGTETRLSVEVVEEIIGPDTETKSATFYFSYKAPTHLPPETQKQLSGHVTAKLICDDQIGK